MCRPRFAEKSLQGFTSALELVLCIHTGASELLAHDKCGGLSSPSGKASPAFIEKGGVIVAGTIS